MVSSFFAVHQWQHLQELHNRGWNNLSRLWSWPKAPWTVGRSKKTVGALAGGTGCAGTAGGFDGDGKKEGGGSCVLLDPLQDLRYGKVTPWSLCIASMTQKWKDGTADFIVQYTGVQVAFLFHLYNTFTRR